MSLPPPSLPTTAIRVRHIGERSTSQVAACLTETLAQEGVQKFADSFQELLNDRG